MCNKKYDLLKDISDGAGVNDVLQGGGMAISSKSIVSIDDSGVIITVSCAKNKRGEYLFYIEVPARQYSNASNKSIGVKLYDIPNGACVSLGVSHFPDDAQITIVLNSGRKFQITKELELPNNCFVIREVGDEQ